MIEVAKAVTYHREEERFLIVQRSEADSNPLKWEFPGGGVEEEDAEKTALRELEEETGLEGKIIEKASVDEMVIDGRDFLFHVFLVHVESMDVELSHEHEEYEWIEIEDKNQFETVDGFDKDLEAVDL